MLTHIQYPQKLTLTHSYTAHTGLHIYIVIFSHILTFTTAHLKSYPSTHPHGYTVILPNTHIHSHVHSLIHQLPFVHHTYSHWHNHTFHTLAFLCIPTLTLTHLYSHCYICSHQYTCSDMNSHWLHLPWHTPEQPIQFSVTINLQEYIYTLTQMLST